MFAPKLVQVNAVCDSASVAKVQLSVELLFTKDVVKVACPLALRSIIAGLQIIVGAIKSRTVTLAEQVAELPL